MQGSRNYLYECGTKIVIMKTNFIGLHKCGSKSTEAKSKAWRTSNGCTSSNSKLKKYLNRGLGFVRNPRTCKQSMLPHKIQHSRLIKDVETSYRVCFDEKWVSYPMLYFRKMPKGSSKWVCKSQDLNQRLSRLKSIFRSSHHQTYILRLFTWNFDRS